MGSWVESNSWVCALCASKMKLDKERAGIGSWVCALCASAMEQGKHKDSGDAFSSVCSCHLIKGLPIGWKSPRRAFCLVYNAPQSLEPWNSSSSKKEMSRLQLHDTTNWVEVCPKYIWTKVASFQVRSRFLHLNRSWRVGFALNWTFYWGWSSCCYDWSIWNSRDLLHNKCKGNENKSRNYHKRKSDF